MHRIWLAAKTLGYPQGGGHLWAYLNWALGLKALGCEVTWLESVDEHEPPQQARARISELQRRLAPYGLADRVALCGWGAGELPGVLTQGCVGLAEARAADLLLDLQYGTHPRVVAGFRRTALVDIDPGLLQIWMHERQIRVAPHDLYFTIGEGVGRPGAPFPDCGVRWHHTPPPVSLPEWPVIEAAAGAPYTTVSNWWGEWVQYGDEAYVNDKRTAFMELLDLPALAPAPLELALTLAAEDEAERALLAGKGWRVRHAWEVSATPEDYRRYVQGSRGELSCAKPSYVRLDTGWVSDRTLCYLASGKPAVVQHTGLSRYLPDGEGLFRFKTVAQAAQALTTAEADYAKHCRAARALVEEHFDARRVLAGVLALALS